MIRTSILIALAEVLARAIPQLHTTADVQTAVDAVRDRDDCRQRATPYAAGLEDGAISVAIELNAGCTCRGRQACDHCGGAHAYSEPGWATDQSDAGDTTTV